jgi:hypothetical protein
MSEPEQVMFAIYNTQAVHSCKKEKIKNEHLWKSHREINGRRSWNINMDVTANWNREKHIFGVVLNRRDSYMQGVCSLSEYKGVTWLKTMRGRRGEIDCWF